MAEDNDIREKLRQHDIIVQTIDEVAPVEVQPARVLSHLYTYLGKLNRFLQLLTIGIMKDVGFHTVFFRSPKKLTLISFFDHR